jgi:hypothetical protein
MSANKMNIKMKSLRKSTISYKRRLSRLDAINDKPPLALQISNSLKLKLGNRNSDDFSPKRYSFVE